MLSIRAFGGLHVSYKGRTEPLPVGRQTKMWDLLKCLLAFYPNPVPPDKLFEALWPDGNSDDPGKSVKNIVYRLRKMFLSCGSTQDYILFENGSYGWNPNAECFIDFVEFNKHLREAQAPEKSDEERISSYYAAISLYQGEFMGVKWSLLETWMSNFVSFYKRLFLQAVESLSSLYERRLDYENIIELHNKALLIDPHEESLYARLIQVLIKNGEYALAKRQYRQIEKLFVKELDTAPSQTLQSLYDEAHRAAVRHPDSLDKIKELFDDSALYNGPIFCAHDTFTQIYKYGKRADERTMFPAFLGKLSLLNDSKRDFSKAELEHAMKTLLRILLHTLRKGDIVCRYSPNQFLLMFAAMDAAALQHGMRRIELFFKEELKNTELRLKMEILPIKDEGNK